MASDIMLNGLRLRFHTMPPLTTLPPPGSTSSGCHLPHIRKFIPDLLSRHVIRKVQFSCPRFFSRLFVVPKKGGSLRLVIDLSRLNKFIVVPTFRMESVWTIAAGWLEAAWGITVDLEDAYFNVPISEFYQHFFAFVVDGEVYIFLRLPFGLALAPWAFHRVMRPIKGFCHRQGLRLHSYLDDFFLLHRSLQGLREDTAYLLGVFRSLGINVNYGKSNLTPSRTVEYLGVTFHLNTGVLSLPMSKVVAIHSMCRSFGAKSHSSRRQLEHLVGTLNFAAQFVPLGVLHLRPLVTWMNFHTSPSTRDLRVPLDSVFKSHLQVWQGMDLMGASVPMSPPSPSINLMTDSSLFGWSGIVLPYSASGVWPPSFSNMSINWLELMAIKKSLKHFVHLLRGRSVLLMSDNSTSVSCIQRQGTYRSADLMSLSRDILMFCQRRSITLVPRHLSGDLNVLADLMSREGPTGTEWSLDSHTFLWLSRLVGHLQVDLFATRYNTQLQDFVSPFPDPLAVGVDAFSLNWNAWDCVYLFPPVKLLHRVVPLLSRYQGRGVLVAPMYSPSSWFPALRERCPDPVPLPDSLVLSQTTSQGLVSHPNPAVYMLHAWRL